MAAHRFNPRSPAFQGRWKHFSRPVFAAAIAVSITIPLVCGSAFADEPRRDPTPTPPPRAEVREMEAIQPGRMPLLREGSAIVQAPGIVRPGQREGTWQFVIDQEHDHLPAYRLHLQPATYLHELVQVINASPGQELIFKLTGRVYVYRNRNYLLLTNPPRVIGHRSPDEVSEVAEDAVDSSEADEAAEDRPRSARDLLRELERETGPIARPAPGGTPRRAVGARDHLLGEGTSILMRRGRVSRDDGGAWRFVFDADASGQADPPMTIMPCRLLERIEHYVQRAGSHAPLLVSGHVYVYDGRNYLLPTMFRIPYERTLLQP